MLTPSIYTQSLAAESQEEKEPKEQRLLSLEMMSVVSRRRLSYSEDKTVLEKVVAVSEIGGSPATVGETVGVGEPWGSDAVTVVSK